MFFFVFKIEPLAKKFQLSRETVGEVPRSPIYPNECQYDFIGLPDDYIENIESLRKHPENEHFLERREMDYPIMASQKYGFEPYWLRDFKKNHAIF